MPFIYVMDEESKDKLLALGYRLIKGNEEKRVWVFDTPEKFTFSSAPDVPHVASNMLVF